MNGDKLIADSENSISALKEELNKIKVQQAARRAEIAAELAQLDSQINPLQDTIASAVKQLQETKERCSDRGSRVMSAMVRRSQDSACSLGAPKQTAGTAKSGFGVSVTTEVKCFKKESCKRFCLIISGLNKLLKFYSHHILI